MAISPIDIATQGLLDSPLSVAAVRGHLTVGGPAPRPPGGGGRFVMGRWIHPAMLRDQLMKQAEREDEEILVIIQAFLRNIRR
jgi:hypothetical protein